MLKHILRTLAASLLLVLPVSAQTQSIAGDWDGTIVAGPAKLRVVFHIEADGASGVLISVDQGGTRIPVSAITRDGNAITMTVPAAGGGFTGTLSGDGKSMTGTWTQGGAAIPLTLTLRAPGVANPAAFAEPPPSEADHDVTLDTRSGTLAGTLDLPQTSATHLAVLIIAGSGPTDRNGNAPALGLHEETYRLLAYGLERQGIVTLRTDKRGIGGSAGALRSEGELTIDTYVSDYRAWAKWLKMQVSARCVWLAGHSEGSLIAELVAKDNPDICGLVLLSGPGRRLSEVLRSQLAQLPEDRRKAADTIIDALAAGHRVDAPANDPLFRPSVQPLWISEFALDPAALLGQLKVPVMIVQGDADRKVLVEDARLLAAARPDAELMIVPGMFHELKLSQAPEAGLAPGLMDRIAAFVRSHGP